MGVRKPRLEDSNSTKLARDPTVNDDSSKGFQKGNIWINTNTQDVFIMTDTNIGSANWTQMNSGGESVLGRQEVVLISASKTNFANITNAVAAAVANDVIIVGPGTYNESFTVPASVEILGLYGADQTTISGSIVLSDGSSLHDFTISVPSSAIGVSYSGASAANIGNLNFIGNSSTSCIVANSGRLTIDTATYQSGASSNFIDVKNTSTVIFNECFGLAGTLDDFVIVESGGVLKLGNVFLLDTANYTDVFEIAGRLLLQNARIKSVSTNAIHVTSDSAIIDMLSTSIDNLITNHIFADPALTTPTILFSSGEMRSDKVVGSAEWLSSSGLVIQAADRKEADERLTLWSELQVGRPEAGRESVFGEGDSYTRGMVVLTTDNTANSTSDGGNFIDVSEEASSADSSTFSFQGTTANHTILIASSLENTDDVLQFWGLKILNTTAAVEVSPKSFAFEVWTGAAWEEIDVLASQSDLYYRYANEVFIRANNSEQIRFGLGPEGTFQASPGSSVSTWTKKTINSQNLFWARIRIATTVTTAPVFEQFKLSCNRAEINNDGTQTFHGSSRFNQTISTGGNIFGESGGVTDDNVAIGSGGVPTGWSHNVKNSKMNGVGDAIYFQLNIPRGTDTSRPNFIQISYTLLNGAGSNDADIICSFLPVEVSGILEADPSGGIPSIPRTVANTEVITSKVAQVDSATGANIDTTSNTKIYNLRFGPFDISDYYEDDAVFIRIELDDDGTDNVDVVVLSIEYSAFKWKLGDRF